MQKKIKGIRVQYTRERQKTRKCKTGDGAVDVYTSKWVHYKKLGFLDDFITSKQSTSNYKVNINKRGRERERERESSLYVGDIVLVV